MILQVSNAQSGTSWQSRFWNYYQCEESGCAGKPANTLLEFGRPRIWEPMFSHGLTLANLSVKNQAFWAVHPYGCDDVIISGLNISAPRGSHNTDGIDPDSTSNVLVENCWVSVGDNSVAIKSGMNWAGREFARASFNQVFRDSIFTCETFGIGSEMSGGVFNITVDNCIFGTDPTCAHVGIHFKAPRQRGGSIHSIHVLNSVFHMESNDGIDSVVGDALTNYRADNCSIIHNPAVRGMPISSSMYYGGASPPGNQSSTPQMYDVLFKNLSLHLPSTVALSSPSKPVSPSFQFLGLPESLIRDFRFQDIRVHSGQSHGWQCQNVSGFSFSDVVPPPTKESGCLKSDDDIQDIPVGTLQQILVQQGVQTHSKKAVTMKTDDSDTGPQPCPSAGETLRGDVAVLAGTAGDVVAAVAAARMGVGRVIIANPTGHLGGMVSGGLGKTDGHPSGGIAQEFFDRVDGLTFSPSMAEAVFDGWAENASLIVVHHCQAVAAQKDPATGCVLSLTTSNGGTVAAKTWVDASYEGELMALAGVNFTVGRESRTQHNESIVGRLPAPPIWSCGCNWNLGEVNGVGPDGAPLPMVQREASGAHEPLGVADQRVQAYNFCLCVTNVAAKRFAFPPPASYKPAKWELLRRAFKAKPHLDLGHFIRPTPLGKNAPGKFDLNNGGGLSTDFVGGSDRWPNGTYSERAQIFDAHREYTLGLFHFMRTDPAVGASVKSAIAEWGLCADELLDDPIHEGRRMVSDYVFTMHDRVNDTVKADSIAVGRVHKQSAGSDDKL